MTKEVKKLIDSVKVTKSSVIYQKYGQCDVVKKSDFDRVVEELTKWNKVKDCLPDGKIELDCICQGQRTHLCCFLGLGDTFIKAYFEKKKIVEWRYIY
jgi:hypothetical protein